MALPDLTGQNIENTYQRVLHTDGNSIWDGTGSLVILNFTGSFSGNGANLTGITASVLATGSDREVQFNNQGNLGASPNFRFNNDLLGDVLLIGGSLINGDPNSLPIVGGLNAHAEGLATTANGECSHAEGSACISEGSFSHAEGNATIASGSYSHAEGLGTITIDESQHAQGVFNLPISGVGAFIIGNGIDGVNRSNLIFASGSEVQITGSLKIVGTLEEGIIYGGSF